MVHSHSEWLLSNAKEQASATSHNMDNTHKYSIEWKKLLDLWFHLYTIFKQTGKINLWC